MTDPLWWITFALSSLIAFFSSALFVEGAIRLFRIKRHRTRTYFRVFPWIFVLLDATLGKMSLGKYLNPLVCDSCIQKWILAFAPHFKTYIALASPSLSILFFISAFAIGLLFLRKIVRAALSFSWLKTTMRNGEVSKRAIQNGLLKVALEKKGVKILLSDEVKTPLATLDKVILFPKALEKKLEEDEFEAVLAHELEHLRFSDPILKLFQQLISSIFCWVPIRWWQNRFDADQELACDESIARYGIEKETLASALMLAAKHSRCPSEENELPLCGLSEKSSFLLYRLYSLLEPSKIREKNPFLIPVIGGAGGILTLASCLM